MQPNACCQRDTAVNDDEIWIKYSNELTRYASILVGPGQAEDVLSTVVKTTPR